MRPLGALRDEIRLGFMVLTRLPVGRFADEAPSMAASAWAWPLVGAAVGALAALAWGIGHWFGLPPPLAAALGVLAGVLATGGLHEDGLADLADGFGGGRDREHVLAIMRDSRIGSYGALALGFSLLIRVAALGAMPAGTGAWALVALAAASRATLPLALCLMPGARSDGLGQAARGVSERSACAALGLGAVALPLLGIGPAIVAALGIGLAALALAALAIRRIGGQTGDVLGAMQQVGELAGWIALAASF